AINSADAATTKPAQRSSVSLWDHNGSILYLVASGQKREFFYQEPREGMLQAGARQGSLLFSGVSKGNQYSGTAFIYKPQCGTFPYRVSGRILDNYRRVVLHGQAPRVSANCKIIGHFTDTLEFVYISSSSKEGSDILTAFTGTWTDTPGVCKSNMDERGASITTIAEDEITEWFSFSWEGEEDRVYGSCGVARGHLLSTGSVVVDLDCDHPGHSQKGVSLT